MREAWKVVAATVLGAAVTLAVVHGVEVVSPRAVVHAYVDESSLTEQEKTKIKDDAAKRRVAEGRVFAERCLEIYKGAQIIIAPDGLIACSMATGKMPPDAWFLVHLERGVKQ
jgi:hypothetical protein